MKTRRVISLTMFLSFIVMSYTGVMLFFTPQGRIAHWTDWHLLGLTKDQYGELHTTFMLVALVAGVWHIVLNWGLIKKYLKNKARKVRVFTPEFNVAFGVTVVFAVGTLAGLPPWTTYIGLGESVKDYWERTEGSPPWGHAEENTLARFSRGFVDWELRENQRYVRLSAQDALTALRAAGLTVESERERLLDIADANSTTPQAIMEILQQAEQPFTEEERAAAPPVPDAGPFPMPAAGLGRMTLRTYCERYNLDLEQATEILSRGGTFDVDRRLREVAAEQDTDPEGLVEILNQRATAARQ